MKIIYQGQTHEFQDGMNALDMLKQLDAQLYKEAVAVRVNGQVRSLPEAVPSKEDTASTEPGSSWTASSRASSPLPARLSQCLIGIPPDNKGAAASSRRP